eukprot:scaffold18254_cov101-Isochrysis_galbana.AAC.2
MPKEDIGQNLHCVPLLLQQRSVIKVQDAFAAHALSQWSVPIYTRMFTNRSGLPPPSACAPQRRHPRHRPPRPRPHPRPPRNGSAAWPSPSRLPSRGAGSALLPQSAHTCRAPERAGI